jgi:hypothetical protein
MRSLSGILNHPNGCRREGAPVLGRPSFRRGFGKKPASAFLLPPHSPWCGSDEPTLTEG